MKSMTIPVELFELTQLPEHEGITVQVYVTYSSSIDAYGLRHDLDDIFVDKSPIPLSDELEAQILTDAESFWEKNAY